MDTYGKGMLYTHSVHTLVIGHTRRRSSAAAAGVLPMRLNRRSARPPSHKPLSVAVSSQTEGSGQGTSRAPRLSADHARCSKHALSRSRCSLGLAAATLLWPCSCACLAAEASSSHSVAGSSVCAALAGAVDGA